MAVSEHHYIDAEGLIIFLDILGIKDIQNRKEAFEMLENWEIVYEEFKKGITSRSQKLKEHDLTAGVDLMGFSDTIIISLPVTIHQKRYRDLTNRDDYWWMVNIIGEALIPLFLTAISKNILLRGAVSVGEFYRCDKMILGPAVKATAPTASKVLDNEWGMVGKALNIFGRYRIPVAESNTEQGWALLWPRKDDERIARQFIQRRMEYYCENGRSDIYLKHKHTLDFYDQFAD